MLNWIQCTIFDLTFSAEEKKVTTALCDAQNWTELGLTDRNHMGSTETELTMGLLILQLHVAPTYSGGYNTFSSVDTLNKHLNFHYKGFFRNGEINIILWKYVRKVNAQFNVIISISIWFSDFTNICHPSYIQYVLDFMHQLYCQIISASPVSSIKYTIKTMKSMPTFIFVCFDKMIVLFRGQRTSSQPDKALFKCFIQMVMMLQSIYTHINMDKIKTST